MKVITLAIIIIMLCQSAQSQQKVTIDYNRELLPKLTIKRGDMFRAEVNNSGSKSTIDAIKNQGYDFYLGHRNYNEPSNMSGSCGKPSEFYKEGDVIKFRLNTNMTAIRAYAKTKQIQVFQQFNRTPIAGHFQDNVPEGSLDIFTFQQGWYRDGEIAKGRPDGLLPVKEQYELFADVVSKYIIACDSAAGINSIWTGFDEPAHTLGFRENQVNNAAREENVRRYAEFFAPLAIKLKAAGKTIGGLQLNAANAGQGLFPIATAELKNHGAYIDYFTVQNYQGGTDNKLVIDEARKALSDPYWKNTKVFFNRYGYWKGGYEELGNIRNSSREMIAFLNGEKIIVDNADIMYGYAMEALQFSDNKDKMLGQLGMFLNKMPTERKHMTFESTDLDGFSSVNDSVLMAVIWNKSGTQNFPDFRLQLSNLPGEWKIMSVRKGSGTTLNNIESYQWDTNNGLFSGVTLKPYDFLLMILNKDEIQNISKEMRLEEDVNFYPNPAKDRVYISSPEKICSVEIYTMQGELKMSKSELSQNHSIDLSGLQKGVYIVNVLRNNYRTTKMIVKL